MLNASIPLRAYESNIVNTKTAKLCKGKGRSECWHGSLESETKPRICLTKDDDGDTYYSPCPYPEGGEIDCDDTNITINPGLGNCNP